MTQSDRPLFSEDTGKRDACWVAEAIRGESQSFGRLVEAYQRAAVATAYRLLGNRDDAAEVAQEAYLRAYRSLSKLKEPTRFGPWLLRIVSNLSLNARRSRRYSSTVPLDEQRGDEGVADGPANRLTSTVGPERRMQGQELQAALDKALEALPDKQRLALVLFTIEGWPQKDIADLLECSLETVKWNVFQARKRLRGLLGDVIAD